MIGKVVVTMVVWGERWVGSVKILGGPTRLIFWHQCVHFLVLLLSDRTYPALEVLLLADCYTSCYRRPCSGPRFDARNQHTNQLGSGPTQRGKIM